MSMSSTIGVGPGFGGAAQCLGAVDRGGHLETGEAQSAFQRRQHVGVVVDHETRVEKPGRNPCPHSAGLAEVRVGGVAAPEAAEPLRWRWENVKAAFRRWTFAHACPSPTCRQRRGPPPTRAVVPPYLKPYRERWIAMLVAAVFSLMATVAIPLMTKAVIDGPVRHRDPHGLWVLGTAGGGGRGSSRR
jgi:hypothetical protein